MRTNIFCTTDLTVDTIIRYSYTNIGGNLGITKADSNGNQLDKFLNLVMINGDDENTEISRVIPICLCDLNIKANSFDITSKYQDITKLGYRFDANELVNEEIGFRLTIPAGFNHRHSWTFSYKIKPGDTTDTVVEKFNNMILNSSIKEHVGVHITDDGIDFLLNEEHNAVLVQPLDSMPSNGISIKNPNPFSIMTATRNYLVKLAIDADANYGFDYVDNAFHELYPNQLSYKDIEKYIEKDVESSNDDSFNYTVFHITFTEPRNVETTGDVVKQVINIICDSESNIPTLMNALASASGIAISNDDDAQLQPSPGGGGKEQSGGTRPSVDPLP